jgi:hypothetical protein
LGNRVEVGGTEATGDGVGSWSITSVVVCVTPMVERQQELETYKSRLPDLAANEGKFALISGKDVVGIFDSYADALKAGYEKLDLRPFLIKQISTVEHISFFSRSLACPT